MTGRSVFGLLFLGAVLLAAFPATARAQSAISGVVTDTTGSVLPGVTVEARSPALIEKVRSAVTDDRGAYRVVDLRPGSYSVTFTLPGFATLVREGIQLEANFTAPINVQMKIGGLEETVTVSGMSPVVDVQTTSRREVLSREVQESLPSARTFQIAMQSLPAVTAQNAKFDVGGNQQVHLGSGSAYGGRDGDFNLTVDDMTIGAPIGSGDRVGTMTNEGGFEESVFTVSGGGAEVQTPGIKVNLIPKLGGNTFKGQTIVSLGNDFTQWTNIDDNLLQRRFTGANEVYWAFDVNPSIGGPILRDKLWFFFSYRKWGYLNHLPSVRTPDGSKFHDYAVAQAIPLRITYQVTPKNKFSGSFEGSGRETKYDGVASGLIDLQAASRQAIRAHYYTQGKWTSTITNRMLFEAGHSFTRHDQPNPFQPGTNVSSVFPYGDIRKVDLITGRVTGSAGDIKLNKWYHHYSRASLTYATGSHATKVGIQQRHARAESYRPDVNGSVVQRYRNGVPDSVQIAATPVTAASVLKWDFGLFAQDTWTMNRLTLNTGVRWDYYYGYVPEQESEAGRWKPAAQFDAITNIPAWHNISPRLGASYDLFGNARTALKGSVGRYMNQYAIGFIEDFNPQLNGSATNALVSDTRTWRDLNGNDIAEESELGPSTNAAFGRARIRFPNEELKRDWQMLYNVTVQHELSQGVAVNVSYNRREFYDQHWTDNLATVPSDYSRTEIPDPRGNGKTVPVYILNASKVGQVNSLTSNSDNKQVFNAIDFGINARFGNGALLSGGTSTGRTVLNACQLEDPNGTTTTSVLHFCDEAQLDIPFETQFKLTGIYPLPFGLRVSGSYRDSQGNRRNILYSVGRAIVPALTVPTVNVQLNAPGADYYERVRILDFSLQKMFSIGRLRLNGKVDLFNALNANTVTSEVTTFGSSLGQPTGILNPRILRFGAVVDF